MSYCLNPQCQNPQNREGVQFCEACGSKLLLRERYRAIKPLGRGGFGKTFLAVDEDKPSKPPCVIKQFLPQVTNNAQKAAELFHQEAERLDELGKHPQIPELLAHFQQDSYQYLVQEYIDGLNLAQQLAKTGPFTESQIKELLDDLLPVLHFIHQHKVIHRDVKPENIIRRGALSATMTGWGAKSGQLVLVDFGAAKVFNDSALLQAGTIIGSPEYVAPEQIRGQAIFASDLYSLGVTCIHLLTQQSPFNLYDVNSDGWVWRDYVSNYVNSKLAMVLDKMLETNPNRRYRSAAEVVEELRILGLSTVEIQQVERSPSISFKISSPAPAPMPAPTPAPTRRPRTTSPTLPPPEVEESLPTPQQSKWKCALTFIGHFDSVTSVAFSPDGKTLASGSRDKTIEIWDLKQGRRWYTLTGHQDAVEAIAFSPDSKTLASGSRDNTIEIWDLEKGKRWYTLIGHSDWVYSVAFSPAEEILASAGKDKSIEIWDLKKGKRWYSLVGHSDRVYGVAFSPDGKVLVSASRDKTVKVWDMKKGKELFTLKGHKDWVRTVAFSSSGATFATGSRDGTIKFWQNNIGQEVSPPLKSFEFKNSDVLSLAFSKNEEFIAAGYRDRKVRLWELKTGNLLEVISGHADEVLSVAISKDGKSLASGSGDKCIKIWRE